MNSLTAAGGALGSATQNLVLNINEMPFITSPPVATFFVGVPGSFDVTTAGYPSTSNQPFSASQPLATLAAMHFEGTGLPASLSSSNLNAEGFLTGTLDISGKPLSTSVGTYTYSPQVNNGIGVAYQNLSVRVLPFTPILIRDVVVRNSWHVLDVLVCGFFGGKISKTLGWFFNRGQSDVVGRKITVNDNPYEVIGVMPLKFYFMPARDIDICCRLLFPSGRARTSHGTVRKSWRD